MSIAGVAKSIASVAKPIASVAGRRAGAVKRDRDPVGAAATGVAKRVKVCVPSQGFGRA